jgi:hypothetical protein
MAIAETCPSDPMIKIMGIQKIHNPILFERFTSELKRTMKKYQNAKVCDLVSLLFFGNKKLRPL